MPGTLRPPRRVEAVARRPSRSWTQGILVGSREMFEGLIRAMAVNQVHPVIDKVFPFEHAREAYHHFEGAAHFGKVCIAI
jgi:NADPH:quinone reductase-like Zn-dependent oxidoreductase